MVPALLLIMLNSCSTRTDSKITSTTINRDSIVVAMFLSDFHIGENEGAVSRIKYNNDTVLSNSIYCNPKVIELAKKLDSIICKQNGQKIKYLILLGDIIDVAVHEESDAFNLANDFFKTPICDSLTFMSFFENVIYIQGNHDHHLWRMLQEKYYVEDRMQQGDSALPFPQQLVGVLDLNNNDTLLIPDSHMNSLSRTFGFMRYVFGNKPVYYVYPNLYINTNDSNDICVTHGHFFEQNWNKTDKLVPHFSRITADNNYFKNIEMKNFPFTEFSDYGMAQVNDTLAQNLTDGLIYNKEGNNITKKVGKYLGTTYKAFFPLDTTKKRRSDMEKLNADSAIVNRYLRETNAQMKEAKQYTQSDDMSFGRLLYGHTHIPCFNDTFSITINKVKKVITAYNTGGWVRIDSCVVDKDTIKTPNPMILRQTIHRKIVSINI
jgi:predicted phosphodiesterase